MSFCQLLCVATHVPTLTKACLGPWQGDTHTHTRSRSLVATLRPFVFVLVEDQTVKQQEFLSSFFRLLTVGTFPVLPFIHDQLIKKADPVDGHSSLCVFKPARGTLQRNHQKHERNLLIRSSDKFPFQIEGHCGVTTNILDFRSSLTKTNKKMDLGSA